VSSDQKILDKLGCELTRDLVGRLVAYCAMKASRRRWYGLLAGEDPPMAKGQKAEDIVQTVIMKTIAGATDGRGQGRRIWDGSRDLYDFLTSQIDSELSNLGRSWVNQRFRIASRLEKTFEDGQRENYYDTVPDESRENPEETALRTELESSADEFVSGFLDEIEDDDFLIAVVEQILDGLRKPREIAEALGVQVDEVYTARKRLRRRLDAYCVSHQDAGPVN